MRTKLILFFIIILACIFRFTAIDWDQGNHLHPDERAIVLAVLQLQFPTTVTQFLSVQSPWNPHFFAYGSFPLYLLKLAGIMFSLQSPALAGYDGITLLGRFLSSFFDLLTILFIFLIGRKLQNNVTGLIGAFFYAVSVLPIQLSHFYAVDTILTAFITLSLYLLLQFYHHPSVKKAIFIGISIAFALATKISATVIGISVFVTLIADFFILVLQHPLHPQHWLHHVPKFFLYLIKDCLLIGITIVIIYYILEPYAFIDATDFLSQTQAQDAMTKSAFTFPYTLQYVGIIPYWYEIKNIFLWGMGPLLAIISFLGTIYVTFITITKHGKTTTKWASELILVVFFWSYFAIVGHFAVGFIRYMLPEYPLLCIFGAMFTSVILNKAKNISSLSATTKNYLLFPICYLLFAVCLLIWPVSFMHIYTQPNTRVLATNYINQTIPAGTGIAVEHWDDELPLVTASNYRMQTLPLYDADTEGKWVSIISQLDQVDYIVIASNRLYIPIQKLNNCHTYTDFHCYPISSIYYKNLFSGEPILQNTAFAQLPGANNLVFKEIKEFSVSPQIPFLNIPINDQGADESFTVYDHPKVILFKKQ